MADNVGYLKKKKNKKKDKNRIALFFKPSFAEQTCWVSLYPIRLSGWLMIMWEWVWSNPYQAQVAVAVAEAEETGRSSAPSGRPRVRGG